METKPEWLAIWKPWEHGILNPRSQSRPKSATPKNEPKKPKATPKPKPRAASPAAGGGKKPFLQTASFKRFCPNFLKCPGCNTADGGDGSCKKLHLSEADAKMHIAEDRKAANEAKKAAKAAAALAAEK